jgi:hypothetical protein
MSRNRYASEVGSGVRAEPMMAMKANSKPMRVHALIGRIHELRINVRESSLERHPNRSRGAVQAGRLVISGQKFSAQ